MTDREAIARAFKNCNLDCAQWDMKTLLELADVAVKALKNWYVPEHGNVIEKKQAMIPQYDPVIVQRKVKLNFTPEQQAAARAVLRELGMI